ncbi:hypothetical protein U9M48_012809 [Paspalum notatum var. saurae]|uniref:Uncharacterized protein n=1 Tax=Paspalum notatum var. saurae TaxID=547442 RepID=A0AAQ3SYM2_PASNO
MSPAPPPPCARAAFRHHGAVPFSGGRSPSINEFLTPRKSLRSSSRVYCLSSGGDSRKKQDEARKALENALMHKELELEIERRVQQQRRRQGDRPGGPTAGGGGWSGGGWFRRLTSGGFWDAAKQIVLTILGIVTALFLIANFNVLVAAVINSLLLVLRQIRRTLSFIAHCVFQGALVERSGPKSSALGSSNVAGVPAKERVGMSAEERE